MKAAEFVARYIAAWNEQDAQAIADTMSETGTYLDIPVHQQMSKEELIIHLEELFERESYFYELAGPVCSGENTVAFQYKATPRSASQNGEGVEPWFGAEFISLSSGVATAIVDYYEQNGEESAASPLAGVADAVSVQRYAKSGLSAAQMEELKGRLTELMEVEHLYLEPNLTLPELADMLNCSVNHLSQVINAGFGSSFFDYLNGYRVKEAMVLLGEVGELSRTVLSVALQVGFNSTSTFYVAFKKVTGETPAQYRKRLSQVVTG